MHTCEAASTTSGQRRPRLEVAEIFRQHGEVYEANHALSRGQRKVMRDIVACRTAVLGAHMDTCDTCGHEEGPSYNSCRNRHCPKCQCLRQAVWVSQRMKRVLPTNYFHVVFTVPHELNMLARCNQAWFYNQLFAAASRTLLELARDPGRLGAQIGVTAVLHTWTRDLGFHPHLHCIVTGGGLSPDGLRWVNARQNHLFPIKVVAKLFRGKLLDALARAWRAKELFLGGPCQHLTSKEAFDTLKDQLYRTDWVTDIRKPFAGPQQVFSYLGRYIHRVAISNQRLLSIKDGQVRFVTKDGKSATLSLDEFARRFLLHVLPDRFVKIRHYGLMAASNATTRLELARRYLLLREVVFSPSLAALVLVTLALAQLAATEFKPPSWRQQLKALTGVDLTRCTRCGIGTMIRRMPPRPPPPFQDTS